MKLKQQQQPKCSVCGKNISSWNKSGFCSHHYLKWYGNSPKGKAKKREWNKNNEEKMKKSKSEYYKTHKEIWKKNYAKKINKKEDIVTPI